MWIDEKHIHPVSHWIGDGLPYPIPAQIRDQMPGIEVVSMDGVMACQGWPFYASVISRGCFSKN